MQAFAPPGPSFNDAAASHPPSRRSRGEPAQGLVSLVQLVAQWTQERASATGALVGAEGVIMRIVNGMMSVVLALLAFAKFGDPNAMALVPALVVAAFWTGIAALVPIALAMRPLVVLLSFSTAAVLLGVWYYWPGAEGLLRTDTWVSSQMGAFVFVAATMLGPMLTSIQQEKLRRQKRIEAKEAQIAERHRGSLARGA